MTPNAVSFALYKLQQLIDLRQLLEELYCANRCHGYNSCPERLAGATGLEPAASCVTGQRSNQLSPLAFHTIRAKPACLLSILAVNRFACFNPFHRI